VSEKRRGLGRGLGALIPSGPNAGGDRPVDVFFPGSATTATVTVEGPAATEPSHGEPASGETPASVESTDRGAAPTSVTPEPTGPEAETADDVSRETTGATTPEGSPEEDADALVPVPGAHFAEIPVGDIVPNPRQPRTVFDEDEMAELVHSVREIGVLQPVVVRPADGAPGRYELIMGERRWRASTAAGLATVPAIVRETAEDDLLRDALLENLHRSQLNPLEEAAAYSQLLEDFGCTHDELAGRIGRSRPQISNTLRLLKLPPLVQRRVAAGVLSAGHARALLGLAEGSAMERLAQRIVAEGLSVRAVEEIVALGGDEEKRARPRAPKAGGRHAELDDLAQRLSDRFDTRVQIALGRRKGRLSVEFASVEDLNRIVALLAPGDAAFGGGSAGSTAG
jgi:ParB family chromosome partitioning protein